VDNREQTPVEAGDLCEVPWPSQLADEQKEADGMNELNDTQKELVESMVDLIQAKARVEHEMEAYGFNQERTSRWNYLDESLNKLRRALKATLH
jgi:hypothetical protein